MSDIRQWMDYIDKSTALVDDRRAISDLIHRVSDRSDEDIILFDGIALHVAKYRDTVVVAVERIWPVVQNSLDSERKPGSDCLGCPREDFPREFAGADDHEILTAC